jgi:hypothetical protein
MECIYSCIVGLMDKLRSLFKSDRMHAPEYDKPFITRRTHSIPIPPKPSHMCGKSIAPRSVRDFGAHNKENASFNHAPMDNDADVSRVLFGSPIEGIFEEQKPSKAGVIIRDMNPQGAVCSRYPTIAIFGNKA